MLSNVSHHCFEIVQNNIKLLTLTAYYSTTKKFSLSHSIPQYIVPHPFSLSPLPSLQNNYPMTHYYFSSGCLVQLLSQVIISNSITCPKCQQPTLVPDGKVENLAQNFALMEVIRSLPRSRSASPDPRAYQTAPPPPPDPVTSKCPDHGDHFTSYCINDGKLICSTCLVYGSHTGHKTLGIKEAAAENRRKLQELHPGVLQQWQNMEKAVTEVEAVCDCVQKTGGEVVTEIEEAFHELVELIEERKTQLKIEAMQRTQIRVKALKEQAR